MHSNGIKKLPFQNLPDPLRQKYEIILPWFIKPEIAARYWPTSIQNVLTTMAPEIASAKASLNAVLTANARELSEAKALVKNATENHASELSNAKYHYEQAAKELETAKEPDMDHWHSVFGLDYVLENDKLIFASPSFARLQGKIVSIVDATHVIVTSSAGELAAIRFPSTKALQAGASFKSLGRPVGTYRYNAPLGEVKQIKYFEHLPSITREEFIKAGEKAFPEIGAAKKAARESLEKNERDTRATLMNTKRVAEEALTTAQEALAKTETATAESEKIAREQLSNAGRSTYERLLLIKMQEEAAVNRQRAELAAQKAQTLEKYYQEQEAQNRQARTAQEAESRRARTAQQERFRIKGPEDFQ
jgi:hypothetical protein